MVHSCILLPMKTNRLGGQQGVITVKDLHAIIKLKEAGHSDRKIATLCDIDRKTIAKYWHRHQNLLEQMKTDENRQEIQEAIVAKPSYDSSARTHRKYTEAIDALLDQILEEELVKDATLGSRHKQKLTHVQIHEMIRMAGHDIGLTVISDQIKMKRAWRKEAFIRQEYDFGQRLEYDFGEAGLEIKGIAGKYSLAVLSSPAGAFRWAYLYKTQKKDVFIDSHVRFFEMAGGVYDEIVYDNMKHVVSKFIGRNEKQLNAELLKLSLYYGFKINVTNCFRGNEKGHVESSVKFIRNKVFASRYRFDSFEEAEAYLYERLVELNRDSAFEEERTQLLPYRPPLELAQVSTQKVDKYSFVRVENNFYSVPDYLVGREVIIKNYVSEIVICSASKKVCTHKKLDGFHQMRVEINHYLDTFMRKPGALKNSVALKSKKTLKDLYDTRYVGREKDFIILLRENQSMDLPSLLAHVKDAANPLQSAGSQTIEDHVTRQTLSQLRELTNLFLPVGGERNEY